MRKLVEANVGEKILFTFKEKIYSYADRDDIEEGDTDNIYSREGI